jgi:hypothetical protein
MRQIWHNIRCLMAEMYIGFAMAIVPKGSDEELGICMAWKAYQRTLEFKGNGFNDQDTINNVLASGLTPAQKIALRIKERKDAARRK